MEIEDYKRIDGWLNVRVNPQKGQSLYDWHEGAREVHSLSDAHELYKKYMKSQPERLSPEAPEGDAIV